MSSEPFAPLSLFLAFFLSTCRKDASSSKCSYSSITSLLKPSWFLAPICEPCSSSSLVATMKSSLSARCNRPLFSFLFFSFLFFPLAQFVKLLSCIFFNIENSKENSIEMRRVCHKPETLSLSLKNTIEKPLELNMGE